MEKLTINDLPEDVLERMRRAIREDSQMIALKNKHSQYIINRQYAKAVLLKEKMQKIEDRVIREYLDSFEGETENMQSLMSDMSPEDREYINTCTNAIFARNKKNYYCNVIFEKDTAMKFLRNRIRFFLPDGTRGDSPGCGSILIAFGEENAEVLRMCDTAGKYVRIN